MTNITVFKPTVTTRDLNLNERKELYELLQTKTEVPKFHFNNILHHSTNVINCYDLHKSDILILNIKQLIGNRLYSLYIE